MLQLCSSLISKHMCKQCTSNFVVRRYVLVMGNVGIKGSINALNWQAYVVIDLDLYNRIP